MFSATLLLSSAGVAVHAARVKSHHKTFAGIEVRDYQPGTDDWIVAFKKGTTKQEVESFCAGTCDLVSEGNVAWATVKGTQGLERMVARNSNSAVEYIQPDGQDSMIPVEEDTSDVGVQASTWGLNAINADMRSNKGDGVHIYVQDTGVRITHFLFGGRASAEMSMISGKKVVCNPTDRTCTPDNIGHGTHCAGTAAGGTYGVAPNAYVHAIRTLGDSGTGDRAFQYVGIEHVTLYGDRPAVLSMSLGGMGKDQTYSDLITAATDANVVVVVASGNFGISACEVSPAWSPDAITVAASTSSGGRAQYSNYGECVDIYAPGSHILSLWNENDLSTNTQTGTSMACPHVSGAAALTINEKKGRNAREVWAAMKAHGSYGKVAGLKQGDPDLFLNTPGAPAPGPTPPPTPAPPMAPCERAYGKGGSGPDRDGDCKCPTRTECEEDGVSGCTFSLTASKGATSIRYFSASCKTCLCEKPY